MDLINVVYVRFLTGNNTNLENNIQIKLQVCSPYSVTILKGYLYN